MNTNIRLTAPALLWFSMFTGQSQQTSAISSTPSRTEPRRANIATGQINTALLPIKKRPEALEAQLYSLPLSFEENRGQIDSKARFFSRNSSYSLFLTDQEAVIASGSGADVVRMRPTRGNAGTSVHGEKPLPGKVNYLSGNDRGRWLTNVPIYANARYRSIYPGIDLLYHGNRQQVEFDFIVAANADPKRIRLHFSGARSVRLNAAGQLLVSAKAGTLVFHKPSAYQEGSNEPVAVRGEFAILGKNTVGFSLGAYDTARPLIIDPTLSYATYLGGTSAGISSSGFGPVSNTAAGITVDSAGNAYVTGSTQSHDFPVTRGAFQTGTFAGKTSITGFVTKLNPSGTALVYSTYLGGESVDQPIAIAVDAQGSAYVAGGTTSTHFPTTKGALQSTCSGYCGFVSKLSADGTGLTYSTYAGNAAGNAGFPFVTAMALNGSGNVFLTGYTNSSTFPTTPGAFHSGATGGTSFLAELDQAGGSFVYSTLLGGVGLTFSFDVALDHNGNAYVAGFGPSIAATPGAYQTGQQSGFVMKIDPRGANAMYSTHLGGSGGQDMPFSIAVDGNGNAYVTGWANSTDFPTTPGAYQTKGSGLFVSKLNPTGTGLVYSTFLNPHGSPSGFSPAIALDTNDNAYITGLAGAGLPVTTDAFSKSGTGGFLTVLDNAGATALYSTYVGGDEGTAIALDNSGNVYIAGIASTANVPVTPGAFQTKLGTGATASFLAKFSFLSGSAPVISGVVNAASSVPGMVPGSFASIYGTNLSTASAPWDNAIVNGALPTSIDAVSVSVAGKAAYISYVSPNQINFLVPNVPPGSAPVIVTNASGSSAPFSATSATDEPAFFLLPNNQPVATHLDYTLAVKNGTYPGVTTVPAHPGETVILWGTGFGPTSPAAPVGMVLPSQPTYLTAALPTVNISTLPARVFGAALAPGFAGLYQIAVEVPSSLSNGDWPILATIGGVQSEAGIVLTVQQ